MAEKQINELLSHLRGDGNVYIQTHDFPDHDSVTSALGLQYLLRTQGINAAITYEGELQRESLLAMNDTLGIVLHHSGYYDIHPDDRIVVVDGCTGNRNVSRLLAREIGVIDHHMTEHPEDVPFVDIRPAWGACATIIFDYLRSLDLPIPRDVATALLIGVSVDTAQLMRGASDPDVQAYTHLYQHADIATVKSVLGNSIQERDLSFYRSALDNVLIHDHFAFCYLPRGCSRNLLGILSDFFAGLREVDVVVLCAPDGHRTNFSVRCAHERWNASLLVQESLKDIGFGGGHRHMAGGSIYEPCHLEMDQIYQRFCAAIGIQPRPLPAHITTGI